MKVRNLAIACAVLLSSAAASASQGYLSCISDNGNQHQARTESQKRIVVHSIPYDFAGIKTLKNGTDMYTFKSSNGNFMGMAPSSEGTAYMIIDKNKNQIDVGVCK